MTPDGFRRIALGLDGVIEKAHRGHHDFRVGGRVFATLGYPDRHDGVVVLTPDQQRSWVHQHAAAFAPVKGTWGEQGCTTVRLAAVDEDAHGEAITLAWQNGLSKGPVRSSRPAARKKSARRAVSSRSAAPRRR